MNLLKFSKLFYKLSLLKDIPEFESEDQLFNYIDELIIIREKLSKIRFNIKHPNRIPLFDKEIENIKGELSKYDWLNNDSKLIFEKLKDPQLVVELLNEYKIINEYLVGIEDEKEKLMHQHIYGGDMYIRFGKYPKSEISGRYMPPPDMEDSEMFRVEEGGGSYFGKEKGISCYKAMRHKGKWLIVSPYRSKAMNLNGDFDPEFFKDQIIAGDIYLVTGKELLEKGADGEPLLKDIYPIRKLTPDEILLNDTTNLLDYLSKLQQSSWSKPFPGFQHPVGSAENIIERWFSITGLDNSWEIDEEIVKYLKATDEEKERLYLLAEKISENGLEEVLKNVDDLNFLLMMCDKIAKAYNKMLVFKKYRPLY